MIRIKVLLAGSILVLSTGCFRSPAPGVSDDSNVVAQEKPKPSVSPSPTPKPSVSPSPTPTDPTSAVWQAVPCGPTNNIVPYMDLRWSNQSDCKPYSINLSPSRKVARFEIHAGDNRWNGGDDGSSVNRDELMLTNNDFKPGQEIWGAYSFMLEAGPALDSRWFIVGQMHAADGGGSPPLSFDLSTTDQLRVMTLYDQSVGNEQRAAIQLTRGLWYQIVFRAIFQGKTYTGDALLEVWVNGKKVYGSASGLRMGKTASTYNYWKIGVYRREALSTQSVRYANMELKTGPGALQSRIASPLPIQY